MQPLLGIVGECQNPARIAKQRATRFAQPNAAPVPNEQVGSEFALERDDLLRQGRPGDMYPLGGASEMQLLGDGYEVAQLSQFHESSLNAATCGRKRSLRLVGSQLWTRGGAAY